MGIKELDRQEAFCFKKDFHDASFEGNVASLHGLMNSAHFAAMKVNDLAEALLLAAKKEHSNCLKAILTSSRSHEITKPYFQQALREAKGNCILELEQHVKERFEAK